MTAPTALPRVALAFATLLLAAGAARAQDSIVPGRPADPASAPSARPNAAPDSALPSVARNRDAKLGPGPSDTSAACRAASTRPSEASTVAACEDSKLPIRQAAPKAPRVRVQPAVSSSAASR